MEPKKPIIGKVIRIPDKYTIIIDAGSNRGARAGMEFAIYEEGENIFSGGKALGKIEHVKALTRIKHVQENFSIAETIESEETTTISGSIVSSLKWRNALPVMEDQINPFVPYNKFVKVGDLAREVSRGNGDGHV